MNGTSSLRAAKSMILKKVSNKKSTQSLMSNALVSVNASFDLTSGCCPLINVLSLNLLPLHTVTCCWPPVTLILSLLDLQTLVLKLKKGKQL